MRRVVTAAALGAFLGAAPAGARMEVKGWLHDFGVVEQGTQVTHQFVLRNKSRQTVRIEGVSSSCGCTVGAAEGSLLRPRASMPVTVALDTANLVGRTTKTVTVRTSDTQTRGVQLALTGVVLTDLAVTPATLYLGRIVAGQPVRRELVVTTGRPGKSAYLANAVEVDSSHLIAYLEPGPKPGQQKIVVELGFDPPRGRFNDELIIRTTSPRQPVIKVPVFGQVIG